MRTLAREDFQLRISKQVGLIVVALAASMVPATAGVIVGPTMTGTIGGYGDTGLGFTALQDTALQGFVYQNQGLADQIILENATTSEVLYTLNTPAGVPSYTAEWLELDPDGRDGLSPLWPRPLPPATALMPSSRLTPSRMRTSV